MASRHCAVDCCRWLPTRQSHLLLLPLETTSRHAILPVIMKMQEEDLLSSIPHGLSDSLRLVLALEITLHRNVEFHQFLNFNILSAVSCTGSPQLKKWLLKVPDIQTKQRPLRDTEKFNSKMCWWSQSLLPPDLREKRSGGVRHKRGTHLTNGR